MRGRGRGGVRWGGGGGGGGPGGGVPGGGGILNISLFGVISPGMRPNGVFFGLFWPFFGVFGPPPRKPGFWPLLAKVRILDQNFVGCHQKFDKLL